MQLAEDAPRPQTAVVALPARRSGTIPVTVRLDPVRYDRLKQVVRRLSVTGQSIMQTALDHSLATLERARTRQVETPGQGSLLASTPAATEDAPRRMRQDSFSFVRPEPTVAVTYRATVSMHRWLHRRAHDTGRTIQDVVNDALIAARGEG